MVLSHERLEVGRIKLIGLALSGSPIHEEAVGDSAKHAKHPDPIFTLNSAAGVIVGDVQTLVKAALDAPNRRNLPHHPMNIVQARKVRPAEPSANIAAFLETIAEA